MDSSPYDNMTPLERIRAENRAEAIEVQITIWLEAEHLNIPCECDPRQDRRCTADGWIRCRARLSAMQEQRIVLKETM